MESAQRVAAVRFRMGGIPVEVQVSFFLIIGLFGWGLSVTHWLIWIGVAFVSILVHELGHAVAARSFGSPASISLYGFGGLTSHRPTTVHRGLVITLAGPFTGLALGGIVYVISEVAGPVHGNVRAAVIIALWINVVWSLVNLLPILPLDGGNVLRDVIEIVSGVDREALVRRISIAVAVAGGLWAYTAGYPFSALFALFFIGTNLQGLRAENAGLEASAALVTAWACVQTRDIAGAQAALRALPPDTPVPLHLRGVLALADGETDQGLALIVDGFVQGAGVSPRGLAVQLQASGVTDELVGRLLLLDPPTGLRSVMQVHAGLHYAGFHREAIDLGVRLRAKYPGDQAEIAYNIACSLARLGEADAALKWLETAIEEGFTNADLVDSDADLDSLRPLPRFARLRAGLR